MVDDGPSRLVQAMRFVAIALGVTAMLIVIVLALVTNPAAVTVDLMFSVTGFCAGFLYASYIYDPRVRRRPVRRRVFTQR